jgi:hypothetical protein
MLHALIVFSVIYIILRFLLGVTHLILDLVLAGLVIWFVLRLF